jgi:hypothetical protein
MTYTGTCAVCGLRFALMRGKRSGEDILLLHNDSVHHRCPGAGCPAVGGSAKWLPGGQAIRTAPR